ncbi:MAG: cyclic-di-AMP receptor [Thermaerobacter sp.]|nr:cyclic-di-AMP receptor [Thermaerobacter sp.]
MKLVVAIVQDKDAGRILQALVKKDYRATRLASTGGFLREGNTTLLVGVEEDQVDIAVALIGELGCSREKLVTPLSAVGGPMDSYVPYPVEVTVGGATIFVLPVDEYHRF